MSNVVVGSSLEAVAFLTPDKQVVVIAMNTGDQPITFKLLDIQAVKITALAHSIQTSCTCNPPCILQTVFFPHPTVKCTSIIFQMDARHFTIHIHSYTMMSTIIILYFYVHINLLGTEKVTREQHNILQLQII